MNFLKPFKSDHFRWLVVGVTGPGWEHVFMLAGWQRRGQGLGDSWGAVGLFPSGNGSPGNIFDSGEQAEKSRKFYGSWSVLRAGILDPSLRSG